MSVKEQARLEAHIELNAKYQGKIDQAEQERDEAIAALEKQKAETESNQKKLAEALEKLEQIEKTVGKDKEKYLTNHRKLTESEAARQSLESKVSTLEKECETKVEKLNIQVKKQSQELSKTKGELKELKKLNPERLKKNLEDKKRELKKSAEANAELRSTVQGYKKDVRIHTSTIKTLKEQIERDNRHEESVDDYYMFTSACQNFKVFPAAFQSESRPYLGNEVNYRILDLRDGASLVAYRKGNEIGIDDPKEIPDDVFKFIHAVATIGEDEG